MYAYDYTSNRVFVVFPYGVMSMNQRVYRDRAVNRHTLTLVLETDRCVDVLLFFEVRSVGVMGGQVSGSRVTVMLLYKNTATDDARQWSASAERKRLLFLRDY